MSKLKYFAYRATIILGAFCLTANAPSSEAAAMAAAGVKSLQEQTKTETLVIKVQKPRIHIHGPRIHSHRQRDRYLRHRHRYRPRKHGPRLRYRTKKHLHYYQGFWYTFPFWLYALPLENNYDQHVQWCLSRYRSYNPNTDMYLGYDGKYHRCRSPYRP